MRGSQEKPEFSCVAYVPSNSPPRGEITSTVISGRSRKIRSSPGAPVGRGVGGGGIGPPPPNGGGGGGGGGTGSMGSWSPPPVPPPPSPPPQRQPGTSQAPRTPGCTPCHPGARIPLPGSLVAVQPAFTVDVPTTTHWLLGWSNDIRSSFSRGPAPAPFLKSVAAAAVLGFVRGGPARPRSPLPTPPEHAQRPRRRLLRPSGRRRRGRRGD
jgi:hypothetical protein